MSLVGFQTADALLVSLFTKNNKRQALFIVRDLRVRKVDVVRVDLSHPMFQSRQDGLQDCILFNVQNKY